MPREPVVEFMLQFLLSENSSSGDLARQLPLKAGERNVMGELIREAGSIRLSPWGEYHLRQLLARCMVEADDLSRDELMAVARAALDRFIKSSDPTL